MGAGGGADYPPLLVEIRADDSAKTVLAETPRSPIHLGLAKRLRSEASCPPDAFPPDGAASGDGFAAQVPQVHACSAHLSNGLRGHIDQFD